MCNKKNKKDPIARYVKSTAQIIASRKENLSDTLYIIVEKDKLDSCQKSRNKFHDFFENEQNMTYYKDNETKIDYQMSLIFIQIKDKPR